MAYLKRSTRVRRTIAVVTAATVVTAVLIVPLVTLSAAEAWADEMRPYDWSREQPRSAPPYVVVIPSQPVWQGQQDQGRWQDRGRGWEPGRDSPYHRGDGLDDVPQFSRRDRLIIDQYFRPYRIGIEPLPLNLAKNRYSLPPGLARLGETVPTRIHGRPLPLPLRNSLPPVPAHYQRIVVGSDVLMIHVGSRVIVDIIRNAL